MAMFENEALQDLSYDDESVTISKIHGFEQDSTHSRATDSFGPDDSTSACTGDFDVSFRQHDHGIC
jgi:hypothetical protein